VASLLATAESEARRLRQADHEECSAHLASRRMELHGILSRVALRTRTAVAEAAAEAERLRAQANAILDAAERDTVATRDHVLAHAERVISEAEQTAQAALERGQRRLDEAEAGARVLRERAAAEVSRLQTEAHEHRRAVRDEATSTLAAARVDADTNRAQARDLLIRARAEVAVLAERRDDITAQLGHLSGVIEALAVPERSAVMAGLATADTGGAQPAPQNATPHLSFTTTATTGTK
jgi:hypothetical protein